MTKVPSTGDQSGECRAHGNLGSALFSKGSFREALANHRNQLVLAMKLKDREVGLDVCTENTELSLLLTYKKTVHLLYFLSTFTGSRKFPLPSPVDHLKARTVVQ